MRGVMPASLESPQSAATFAPPWMLEQQRQEIGRRLWGLRENSPQTNRSIGDYVGVSERTVAAWISGKQGMTYDHAQKSRRAVQRRRQLALVGSGFRWRWGRARSS